jgi:hypothetical protein
MLGRQSTLHIHHIFPKALLYKHGYVRGEVNAIANFCFLTQTTNLNISDSQPEVYFPEIERATPGALASQWVPTDPELWKIERYRDFLAARRQLLAQAANSFLDSLLAGTIKAEPVTAPVTEGVAPVVALPGGVEDEAEERLIQECNEWIVSQGLPRGEYTYELLDPITSQPSAILDLAWPRGLQEGLSQPVALLIDENLETEAAANSAGFRFFTDVEDFRDYVEREVLAVVEEVV